MILQELTLLEALDYILEKDDEVNYVSDQWQFLLEKFKILDLDGDIFALNMGFSSYLIMAAQISPYTLFQQNSSEFIKNLRLVSYICVKYSDDEIKQIVEKINVRIKGNL